jgi:hypothetical protein
VDVVQEELPLSEARQQMIDARAIQRAAGGGALEAVEDARLIAIRLQPAQHPRACVGERLVIEVDGVLRGKRHPEAERPGLLQQHQQRLFRRRGRNRRQEPGHLIDIHHRAQARRATLRSHPRDQFIEDERHDEHALTIVEVRDREHGHPRCAAVRVEQPVDVQGVAFEPDGEVGRGEQTIEVQRELEPVCGGIKAVELEHADTLNRW